MRTYVCVCICVTFTSFLCHSSVVRAQMLFPEGQIDKVDFKD